MDDWKITELENFVNNAERSLWRAQLEHRKNESLSLDTKHSAEQVKKRQAEYDFYQQELAAEKEA